MQPLHKRPNQRFEPGIVLLWCYIAHHCITMSLVQFPPFLITACKISKPLVGLQETSGRADLSCINISTFWNRSLHVCIRKTLMHCMQVNKSCEPLELNKQRNVCRPLWKEHQVFCCRLWNDGQGKNEFNHLCCDGCQTLQDNLKEKILYNRTIILNALQNPQQTTWSGTKVLPCFSQFTTHSTENLSVQRAVQARWIKNLTVVADTCRSNGRKYARKWKTLKCCRKSATSCDGAKGSVKYWQCTVPKIWAPCSFSFVVSLPV